jgi:hypothetical protein
MLSAHIQLLRWHVALLLTVSTIYDTSALAMLIAALAALLF